MKGLSLFSGAGIGETYLKRCGVDIAVANELLPKRAKLYQEIYPNSKMICGDIRNPSIFSDVMEYAKGAEFIVASPPCQGMSIAGKNRDTISMKEDERNYLISYVIDAINIIKPKYVVIENVPALLKLRISYKQYKDIKILDLLHELFGELYNIDGRSVDASDYGVPQTRIRAIIKMYPKDKSWKWPKPIEKKITVREAIGHLPSLEAGQKSNIKWHFARPHTPNNILCMKHTASGHSAFENEIYYPKKDDGSKVRGYMSSYRRIKWDEPSPTITIRNDCIASQRNVHPGRLLEDGSYSDARVLTPYELMILTSLPNDWNIPDDTPEILIRQVIGESIPPLMIERIVGELK